MDGTSHRQFFATRKASFGVVFVLGVLGGAPRTLLAQADAPRPGASTESSAAGCARNLDDAPIIVPLDNTGIRDWSFLNPRSPRPVVRISRTDQSKEALEDSCFSKESLQKHARLSFQNETSDRVFRVQVPFTLPTLDSIESEAKGYCRQARLNAGQDKGATSACDEWENDEKSRSAEPKKPITWADASSMFARIPDKNFPFKEEIERYRKLIEDRTDGAQKVEEVCKSKPGDPSKLACEYTFTINPGNSVDLNGEVIAVLDHGRVTFNVTFADETDPPSHAQGYLATSSKISESPNTSAWTFAASIGARSSPKVSQIILGDTPQGATEPVKLEVKRFSQESPYRGAHLDDFTGSGSLTLSQSLGDRAIATATTEFKSGALGTGNDGTTKVKTYSVTINSDQSQQLKFGNYQLLETQSSIAGAVAGEGFEASRKWLRVGAVINANRQVTKDGKSEAKRVYTLQIKDLPFRGSLRTWTLLAVYGELPGNKLKTQDRLGKETARGAPFRYVTLGTQATFSVPTSFEKFNSSGSFALFTNRRELGPKFPATTRDAQTLLREGRGTVGLLGLTFAQKVEKSGVQPGFSARLQLGHGTGDDPKTPNRQEGYLGEGGSFTPDLIFLSSFAGHLGSLEETTTPSTVAEGLSNKTYLGLTLTSTKSALPLEALVYGFRIKDKVISRSTTIQFHKYRFNEPIFGSRDAGYEVDLRVKIEVPKGVTTELNLGRFFVGSALDKVIVKEPWLASAQVKVSL